MFVDLNLQEFLNRLKSDSATPGGGTASAMAGAMSAALLSMVMRVSIKKLKEEDKVREFEMLIERCDKLSNQMAVSMDKDAESFDKVIDAFKLPKRTLNEKENRKAKVQIALKGAALVPITVMETVKDVAQCGLGIVDFVPGSIISDIGVSVLLANSAVEGAYYNVKINLKYIKDKEFNEEIKTRAKRIFLETEETLKKLKQKIDNIVEGE